MGNGRVGMIIGREAEAGGGGARKAEWHHTVFRYYPSLVVQVACQDDHRLLDASAKAHRLRQYLALTPNPRDFNSRPPIESHITKITFSASTNILIIHTTSSQQVTTPLIPPQTTYFMSPSLLYPRFVATAMPRWVQVNGCIDETSCHLVTKKF